MDVGSFSLQVRMDDRGSPHGAGCLFVQVSRTFSGAYHIGEFVIWGAYCVHATTMLMEAKADFGMEW